RSPAGQNYGRVTRTPEPATHERPAIIMPCLSTGLGRQRRGRTVRTQARGSAAEIVGLVGFLVLAAVGCGASGSVAALPLLVTAAPVDQASATTPPGRLVFVAGGDLWQWQNGVVRRLTSGDRYEGPAWSPDGDQLVASIVGANHSDLVLLSPEGEQQSRL